MKSDIFNGKAWAWMNTGNEISGILPLYDEFEIHKTSRKKIQIEISGKFAKGIPNNEKNILYQYVQKFFLKHGFSFGVEIFLTKNIPENSEMGEEVSAFSLLQNALFQFSHKAEKMNKEAFFQKFFPEISEKNKKFYSVGISHGCSLPQENPEISGEIILVPQFCLPNDFVQQVMHYREISREEFFLSSFFSIQKKMEELAKNPEISGFGLVNGGPHIWVREGK